jgi:hypothetical protein
MPLVNNNLYHYSCCRCLRRFSVLFVDFLKLLGIFIGCLLFGSSILSVLLANKIMNYSIDGCPKIFILGIVAIVAVFFQPILLVIASASIGILLAFTIVCFPLVIYYIKRH